MNAEVLQYQDSQLSGCRIFTKVQVVFTPRLKPLDHDHGKRYRVRIEGNNDRVEFSDWFESEDALRTATQSIVRDPAKTYYYEEKPIRCRRCLHLGSGLRIVSKL